MEIYPIGYAWYETSVVGDGNEKRESRQCPVEAWVSSAFQCQGESRAYLVTGGAAKNMSTADMVVSLDGTYSKNKILLELLMFSEERLKLQVVFYHWKLSHKR